MKIATRRIGLAVVVLGLTAGATGRARAGLVLNYASLNDFQQASAPSSSTPYDTPYSTNQSFNQDTTTITDPANSHSYSYDKVSLSGTNSGSSSVLPSLDSFTDLSFALSSDTSLSNQPQSKEYAATSNSESYSGSFSVANSGNYQLTLSATSTVTAAISGYPGGGLADASVYLNGPGGTVASLISQSVDSTPGSPQTLTEQVFLKAGENYTFGGRARSIAHIRSDGYYDASGSISNHADITFELSEASVTATPEPSTLVSAGFAALMGIGYGWRVRRAKLATA